MGVDELPFRIDLGELLTQSTYVHVNGSVTRSEGASPGLFGQFFPADNRARAAGQCDQQSELVTCQIQRAAGENGHVLSWTDLERSFAEHLRQRGFHGMKPLVDVGAAGYPPVNHL